MMLVVFKNEIDEEITTQIENVKQRFVRNSMRSANIIAVKLNVWCVTLKKINKLKTTDETFKNSESTQT